jgi:hypothetical protein
MPSNQKEAPTMHISHHADQRMNQRGISRRLVEFALRHNAKPNGNGERPHG